MIGDAAMTLAEVDRLVHHSTIFVSGGENPHISGAYLVSRDCGDLPCGVREADAVLDF